MYIHNKQRIDEILYICNLYYLVWGNIVRICFVSRHRLEENKYIDDLL